MYLSKGVINLDMEKLPLGTLKYISRVFRRSGVEMIDIFYQEDENIYIGAESLETNMVALYRVSLNDEVNKGNIQVFDDNGEEDGEDDFDLSDFNILMEDGDSTIKNSDTTSFIEPNPILKFSTLVNFIECISLSKTCKIIVDDNVMVRSDVSEITLPLIPSSMTIETYTDMLEIEELENKWETVNTDAVKLIADTSSRTKRNISDMYVSIEGNKIYSDNKDVVFETDSWSVKNNYTFNYSTVECLRYIPSGYEVKVAKHRGKIMLKVEDVYLGWEEPTEISTENIMSYLDVDNFEDIISINRREFGKFNIMDNFSKNSADDSLTITVINSSVVEIMKGNNRILLHGGGRVGSSIVVYDSKIFLQLLRSVDSDAPVISVDPSLEKNPVALIKGNIRILTSIENSEVK